LRPAPASKLKMWEYSTVGSAFASKVKGPGFESWCSRQRSRRSFLEWRLSSVTMKASMFSSSSKASWDTRAWFLGLFLGNFAGLLLLCGGNSTSRRFLEAAFPYSAFGYYTGDFLVALGAISGSLIFPAVLTCVAKRLYVLWGLLPIFLLILWVIAGHIVAQTVPSLFDPAWALPLAALLCWIVASFPVSLFRFFRQNRRPDNLVLATETRRRCLRWLPMPFLTVIALAFTALGGYNLSHPQGAHAAIAVHFLSGNVVRVPIVEKNGGIFVMASLNGQQQLCKIDTGFDNVEWARGLHIIGRLTDERGQSCDSLNNCVDTSTVKLPHIRIGTFEMTDLPTEMLDVDNGLFSPPYRLYVDDTPLLGNSLFALTVLTIDYRNKVLAVRPPTYDFEKVPRHPGDRILQMGWSYHDDDSTAKQQIFGWPAIRASVNGKSFWCVFDSGWGVPNLGLTEDFFQRIPTLQQVPRHSVPYSATHGASTVPQLQRLRFQVPCLSPSHALPILLEDKGLLVKGVGGGEGVVGMHLMERYCITIDYQRQRILLEPYAQAAPGQKQEKTLPKAKQTAI